MMFAPALSRGNRVGFPVIRQCQCPMSFAAFLLDRFELGERLQIFRPSRRRLRPMPSRGLFATRVEHGGWLPGCRGSGGDSLGHSFRAYFAPTAGGSLGREEIRRLSAAKFC